MTLAPELIALARYLAGEFDNRAQAIAEPTWYVHLHLWQRPVPIPLFSEDSLTLFAEQANIINLDRPYRQRIMRILASTGAPQGLQIQYYMLEDPGAFRGAGGNPALLKQLTASMMQLLPGCTLTVTQQILATGTYHFSASLPPDANCCFPYQGETRQVSLGFDATATELLSYDKGIDQATGQALWGAVLGPFRFAKCQDFSTELNY